MRKVGKESGFIRTRFRTMGLSSNFSGRSGGVDNGIHSKSWTREQVGSSSASRARWPSILFSLKTTVHRRTALGA